MTNPRDHARYNLFGMVEPAQDGRYVLASDHDAKVAELEHDIHAYRGALGYPVPGDHDGRLSDGMTPMNGIAEALQTQLSTCEARAEQDAKRYRWLKANHLQLGPDCWIRTGDDLDDATDKALAAEEKKSAPG